MTIRDSGNLFLEVATRPAATGVGIEVDIYDGSSLGTMLATLEGAFEVGFQTVMNDTGSGSFKLNRHDPKAGYVVQDNLAKIKVDGVYRFAFFIETLNTVDASPNGDGAEVIQAGGRGALAYLERAIVYPGSWPSASDPTVTYTAQTKAAILIDQLNKAKARGALTALTWDFTATNDSRGYPWPDSNTLDYHIGTDDLAMAKSLAALSEFDVEMSPAFVLHAYLSQGADATATVVLREGKHLGEADFARQLTARATKTRLLVEGSSSWVDGFGHTQYAVEVSDATDEALAIIGRREAYLNYSKSNDPATLINVGDATLSQLRDQGESLQVPVTHGAELDGSGNATGDYQPFVSYVKGDKVALDVPTVLDRAPYRVVGITLAERDGGDYSVTLDLNSLYLEYLLRIKQQVDGITGGTGGGVSSSSIGGSTSLGGGGVSVVNAGKVAVAASDSPDYLDNKIGGSTGVTVAPGGSGGTQQMLVSAKPSDYILKGTLAARPAAATTNAGWLYFATDVAGGTLYLSDGTAWTAITIGTGSGTVPAGGTVGQYLRKTGSADYADGWATITEADLGLSDVTTADVSATKHGLAPKLTNTGTKFLRDDGTYATPAAGATTLAADTDVSIASPADGDLLQYVASASKWENKPLGAAGAPIAGQMTGAAQNPGSSFSSTKLTLGTSVTAKGITCDTTNSRITALTAGWYLAFAAVGSGVSGNDVWVAVRQNGSQVGQPGQGRATNVNPFVFAQALIYLNVGDYVEAWGGYNGTSGNLNGASLNVVSQGAVGQLFATNYRSRAYLNGSFTTTASAWNKIPYDTIQEDPSGSFSTANHNFVAPATGPYLFLTAASYGAFVTTTNSALALWVTPSGGSASEALRGTQIDNSGIQMLRADGYLWLNAGDIVDVRLFTDLAHTIDHFSNTTFFEAIYLGSAASQADNAWTNLTLLNSWINYGYFSPLRCRKDASGFVHISGAIKNGTTAASCAQLPAGYRPGYPCDFVDSRTSGGFFEIGTDGNIIVYPSGSGTGLRVLDGITFFAEN